MGAPMSPLHGTASARPSIRWYRFMQFAIASSFAAGTLACRSSDEDMKRDVTRNRLMQLCVLLKPWLTEEPTSMERKS